MPAPKPPKKVQPGHPLSAREYNRTVDQVARAIRINADAPLVAHQGPGGTHLGLDTSTFPFLARLTAVYTPTSGRYSGVNIYSFVEQAFDPTTGLPVDANPGRTTVGTTGAMPTSSWATEANNNVLTVPGPTPAGYANPGPYVEVRLTSLANGVPVFEFDYETSPAIVQGFWARITAQATTAPLNLYSFEQVDENTPPNGWQVTPNGVTGTLNAEEINGNATVGTGTIIWLRPNSDYAQFTPDPWYQFEYGHVPLPATWQTSQSLPNATCLGTGFMSADVTLPYGGIYLLTASLTLNSNDPGSEKIMCGAQFYLNGGLVGQPEEFFCWPSNIGNGLSLPVCLSAVASAKTTPSYVSIYFDSKESNLIASNIIINAVLLSLGPLPTASTINGETGGVTIEGSPASGDNAGITVTTSGQTIIISATGGGGGGGGSTPGVIEGGTWL